MKLDVACVFIRVSWCLKEELAWTMDNQPWVISNVMLFKTVVSLS